MSVQLSQTNAFRHHLYVATSLPKVNNMAAFKFGCQQQTKGDLSILQRAKVEEKPVITAYDPQKDSEHSVPVKTCLKMIAWYQQKTRLKPDGTPRRKSIFPCPYTPSCSEYTADAIRKLGVLKGILLGSYRILRCNPFTKGYYYFFNQDGFKDPVK